ncbi:hypothetical protein DFH06DRAFT_622303 [Mycena polygramma]|nr:hypothetical protein DFH06DRAFT_622303 [Mycena polygramma]
MDPITATATLITFATFVKDLIEVGWQGIQASIEKVRENRRRIRGLTNDILRTLADLANLTRGHEDAFQAPALLSALGNLKAEMLHVLSVCREISPAERPGFQRLGSQLRVWMKRDNLEQKIGRLKEHVNTCYLQFTAFSAARIEQSTARIEDNSLDTVNTTLRVEQAVIVHNLESQLKLRRLEGMMTRVLLDTQFGQTVMNQTIEIIASDTRHESIEFQYLSLQSLRLVDSLRQMLMCGNLVLHAPLWDPAQPIKLHFLNEPLSRVLYWIMGKVLEISESSSAGIPLEAMEDMLMDLGICLTNLGMVSEGIAWERLKIRILRFLASGEYSAGTLPRLALTLRELSLGHRRLLRHELALQTSEQSVALWRHLSETLPEVDYRVGLMTAMEMHVLNLLDCGQQAAAQSLAEEAVALSRPMVNRIIASSSGLATLVEEDQFEIVIFSDISFSLAETLASASRYLESYHASKEALEMMLISGYPPSGKAVDSFLDRICKIAEEGSCSLEMLADCVILFRDLARKFARDQSQLSSHFLWLIYAYAYFSQQNISSFLQDLRTFLEPHSERHIPELDTSDSFAACIDRFEGDGCIIRDVVHAFYGFRWQSATNCVVYNTFITHFEPAAAALRELVEQACSVKSPDLATIDWVLYSTLDILPRMPHSSRVVLLLTLVNGIKHLGQILAGNTLDSLLCHMTTSFLRELWRVGMLESALAVSFHRIEYLSGASSDEVDLHSAALDQAFILCDMGRIPEATQTVQQLRIALADSVEITEMDKLCLILQTRILKRMGRTEEALKILRKRVETLKRPIDCVLDLAAHWGLAGYPESALWEAEPIVAIYTNPQAGKEPRECASVVHALTTYSNCLAAIGQDGRALWAVQQAVQFYNAHASENVHETVHTVRRQEAGANAYRALSSRYATANPDGEPDPNQALCAVENAIELYRELVELAPMHLPTLANSLLDLAPILMAVGRLSECYAAYQEAISIIRNVSATEPYFLPALATALEQLECYLEDTGDATGALAAADECAGVRRRFANISPSPDYVFEEVELQNDEGDENEDVSSKFPADTSKAWLRDSDEDYHNNRRAVKFPRVPDPSLPTYLDATTSNYPLTLNQEPNSVPVTMTRAVKTTSHRVADLLNTPLEVRLSSTPMGILWWMLLGILSALVGILSIAVARKT